MDPKITELYNVYIHGDMPRRSFLKQLAAITGGATVANTDTITADVIKGVAYLKSRDDCSGKAGSVGFCYDGGVSIPLMMHYAGNDERVNAMIPEFRAALDANKIAYSLHMYPGTGHGFHNDTSQARYDETAAKLSWQRTINFFNHYLKA